MAVEELRVPAVIVKGAAAGNFITVDGVGIEDAIGQRRIAATVYRAAERLEPAEQCPVERRKEARHTLYVEDVGELIGRA